MLLAIVFVQVEPIARVVRLSTSAFRDARMVSSKVMCYTDKLAGPSGRSAEDRPNVERGLIETPSHPKHNLLDQRFLSKLASSPELEIEVLVQSFGDGKGINGRSS